jgi:hypothetical protein
LRVGGGLLLRFFDGDLDALARFVRQLCRAFTSLFDDALGPAARVGNCCVGSLARVFDDVLSAVTQLFTRSADRRTAGPTAKPTPRRPMRRSTRRQRMLQSQRLNLVVTSD